MENEDCIKAFRQRLLAHGLSSDTAKTYGIYLGQFMAFMRKHHAAHAAKPNREQVGAFRKTLEELSPSSRKNTDAALRKYFGFQVDDGAMLSNPMDGVRSPKENPQAIRPTLTPEEMGKVLATPPADTPIGVRNRAVMEVLYSTAIRLKELLGLSVYDVDLKEGFVWVRGKGRRERKIPIGKSATAWVKRYLEFARPKLGRSQPSSKLFLSRLGDEIKRPEVARLIRNAATAAVVSKKVTPHVFRHTAATEMVRNGAPLRYVQELLGHRFMVTTQVYTRVTNPDLHSMIERCHPSLKSKGKAPTWGT